VTIGAALAGQQAHAGARPHLAVPHPGRSWSNRFVITDAWNQTWWVNGNGLDRCVSLDLANGQDYQATFNAAGQEEFREANDPSRFLRWVGGCVQTRLTGTWFTQKPYAVGVRLGIPGTSPGLVWGFREPPVRGRVVYGFRPGAGNVGERLFFAADG